MTVIVIITLLLLVIVLLLVVVIVLVPISLFVSIDSRCVSSFVQAITPEVIISSNLAL